MNGWHTAQECVLFLPLDPQTVVRATSIQLCFPVPLEGQSGHLSAQTLTGQLQTPCQTISHSFKNTVLERVISLIHSCCCSPGWVIWTPGISCTNKYHTHKGCCCSCGKLQLRQGVSGTFSAINVDVTLGQPLFSVLLSAIRVLMCAENRFRTWLYSFPSF